MPDDQTNLIETDKSGGVNYTESIGMGAIAILNGAVPAFTPPEPAYQEPEITELNAPAPEPKLPKGSRPFWLTLNTEELNKFSSSNEKSEARRIYNAVLGTDRRKDVWVKLSRGKYTFAKYIIPPKLSNKDISIRFRREIITSTSYSRGINSIYLKDSVTNNNNTNNSFEAPVVLYDAIIEGVDYNKSELRYWENNGKFFTFNGKKYIKLKLGKNLIVTNCPEPIPFEVENELEDKDKIIKDWSQWLIANQKTAYVQAKKQLKQYERDYLIAQRNFGHQNMIKNMLESSLENYIDNQLRKIVSIPGTKVAFFDEYLRLTTDPIKIDYQNITYYIGSFNIYLHNDFSMIEVSTNNYVDRKPWHPHANDYGGFCKGSFSTTLGQCILDFDFYSALLVVLEMLRSVNPKDSAAVSSLTRNFSTTKFEGVPNKERAKLFDIERLTDLKSSRYDDEDSKIQRYDDEDDEDD